VQGGGAVAGPPTTPQRGPPRERSTARGGVLSLPPLLCYTILADPTRSTVSPCGAPSPRALGRS